MTRATTFRGSYEIPEGAVFTANLYGAHMDPRVFPDPHEFRPSRFLDEGVNSRNVIPFSMGMSFSFSLAEFRFPAQSPDDMD